ncbi:M3 family oligoendopeptidase [Sulfoacidibacillus thermotolerans]|uniref:Oligoendopeptidase F n=1 Tax=Sulfoacidibacillus thermotolerans TaxID=1765684 RepID=A0A2U3D6L6_SULT2|nr:M3 family oligoendopeptidase [Sulfoacidibacillus thermotolerans]PWI56912.1 oligoendopeptidase F [Sulfoacidibacillus thermotolerans]
MFTFIDMPYVRPNMEDFSAHFREELRAFRSARDVSEQDAAMARINADRKTFESLSQIVYIRHSIDTTDELYRAEQDFFDEVDPIYRGLVNEYYEALVNSPFRAQLEEKWGSQLFRIAELTLRTFSPEVLEDLQQENRIASEYVQLLASAKIPFEGAERTLSQMTPFLQSTDRSMRKRAALAKYGFLQEHEEQLDSLYDELVKTRTRIARKLGFRNFVELAYARLHRTDYDAKAVEQFRKQVRQYIVPAATRLRERQRQRIGVRELYYYDENFNFLSGNATPKGDPDWILANGRTMYRELSPETDVFFSYLVDHQLMDLASKQGKAGGGYCTYIPDYESPFIFANFNGTSGDVDVLTHEAGHAFQVYASRNYEIPEYLWPTYDAAEIHSMSMEFFTWPWMDLFFKEDTDKYKFAHLSGSLLFIPYGVLVDDFQHFVYTNPDATPQQRKAKWRELEQMYLPSKNYEGNTYLEQGGFWHQQNHIFTVPFYYIDYTLAQICAFQFWARMQEDRESAWTDYVHLCQAGGSESFTKLVTKAGLISPFEEGCIESVIGKIEHWLDQIDDASL